LWLANDLPWTYLPTYIALALPELVLVLFLCVPVAVMVALWRGNFHASRERTLAGFVLGIGIVFPVAYAIVIKAVLSTACAHFIFICH